MQILPVITARGGSKGIPRKNLALIAGKPLIAWTIDAALGSCSINRESILFSTDDPEIAQAGRDLGVRAPFLRPSSLSGDHSPHLDVLLHALDWADGHDPVNYDWLLLLQPTSPLRTALDIDNAVSMARKKDPQAIISVTPNQSHPYFAKSIDGTGRLQDFISRPEGYLPRQSLPPVYSPNGAIYLVKTSALRSQGTLCPEETIAYIMPESRSIDVDAPWQLRVAEFLLRESHDHEAP